MKTILLSIAAYFFLVVLVRAQGTSPYWSLAGNNATSSSKLGTTNAINLRIFTNNSEKMRITSSGLVGIGTINPNAKLHINSVVGQSPFRVQLNGSTKLLVNAETGGLAIGAAAIAPSNGLYVNGNVAIGTTSPSNNKLEVYSETNTGISVTGRTYGLKVTAIYAEGSAIRATHLNSGIWATGQYGAGGQFESEYGYGLYASTGSGPYAAYFNGNTYSTGSYLPSDLTLKKNIHAVEGAVSIINKLKPKHYEYKNDGQYTSLHLPKGTRYGLIAQEVEEILPNLVTEAPIEWKETRGLSSSIASKSALEIKQKESMKIKAVNYTELIPLLIQAVQEQDVKIKQLQQENDILKGIKERLIKLEAGNSTGSTIKLTPADLIGVSLEQNHPNPAGSNTTFRYTIPNNANAQILVYNSTSGKLVKTLQAPASGKVEMNATDLEAGTYIYTLVVNGKQTAAKQLMLSK